MPKLPSILTGKTRSNSDLELTLVTIADAKKYKILGREEIENLTNEQRDILLDAAKNDLDTDKKSFLSKQMKIYFSTLSIFFISLGIIAIGVLLCLGVFIWK
ncbi:hypothetical protein [Mycoplasmopsis columbinasalis]|uniref:Uncharacterized protein n=1 Tax=Mycoplasmopsis columbinasalis TaxID=114880 RepID=A0A449BA32_9BACT|nr:hypothetical protein [Mycoplasmopsis columbinasalis]VEU78027.1 Uncharacterised protein [Mycoplasmopsis columbinasalis]